MGTAFPDTWATKFHAANPAPAMAFAVARGADVLWSTALGTINLELGVPASPEHVFRLGSVSKVLTSTAAARLVTRGLIDLDTPIGYWMPELPAHHRGTTLRQLFTHRGGVRHYIPRDGDRTVPGGSIFRRNFRTRADVLATFIDDPLIAEPGTRVVYSTFGFTLASMVMETAAREDFTSLVKAEIGEDFALPSLTWDDPMAVTPGRATGYSSAAEFQFLNEVGGAFPQLVEGWGNAMVMDSGYSWAGAGFMMTVADTARFGAALPASPFTRLGDDERDLLFTPLVEAGENHPPLGLAWRIDADGRGRRRWHHSGATPGGRAGLVVYPETGLSIALASNTMMSPGDTLGAAGELADMFG
jgi:serine beta-lactamase-like protein LACTB